MCERLAVLVLLRIHHLRLGRLGLFALLSADYHIQYHYVEYLQLADQCRLLKLAQMRHYTFWQNSQLWLDMS